MMQMSLMIGGEIPEISDKNKARAEEYWMYGKDASELAKAWDIDEDTASLKACGNCEYYDNRPRILKALGGDAGMGVCTKFKFMCSAEAACQAWDCPDKTWEQEEE
jgi:hypothetical protein